MRRRTGFSRRNRSMVGALLDLLKGIRMMVGASEKARRIREKYTLDQIRIEQGKLKIEECHAKIARANNAVVLQDLEIELKKFELEKERRALGIGADEIKPPFWNG